MEVDPGANVHIVTEADEHPLRNQRHLAQPTDQDTAGGTAQISVVGAVFVSDLELKEWMLDR